jgi:hypothetical protein
MSGVVQTLDRSPPMFYFIVEGLSPRWIELVRRGEGVLCCYGDHDDYTCILGRVTMLGDNGMDSCT